MVFDIPIHETNIYDSSPKLELRIEQFGREEPNPKIPTKIEIPILPKNREIVPKIEKRETVYRTDEEDKQPRKYSQNRNQGKISNAKKNQYRRFDRHR